MVKFFRYHIPMVGGRPLGGMYDGYSQRFISNIRRLPPEPTFTVYYPDRKEFPRKGSPDPRWLKSMLALRYAYRAAGFKEVRQLPSKNVTAYLTHEDEIPENFHHGRQLINTLGVANCLGGLKAQQLACRKRLAWSFGCEYEDMHIQPAQFEAGDLADCKRFWKRMQLKENLNRTIISKPSAGFHGDNIKMYYGARDKMLRRRYGNCKNNHDRKSTSILMDYVTEPALVRLSTPTEYLQRTYELKR